MNKNGRICHICLEKQTSDCVLLRCHHSLHLSCFISMCVKTPAYKQCPICRNPIEGLDLISDMRRESDVIRKENDQLKADFEAMYDESRQYAEQINSLNAEIDHRDNEIHDLDNELFHAQRKILDLKNDFADRERGLRREMHDLSKMCDDLNNKLTAITDEREVLSELVKVKFDI